MKLLLIGDLHGRKPLIKWKNFDAIILPGDIASDKELGRFTKKWFAYLKTTKKPLNVDEYIISKIGKRAFAEMEKRSLLEGNKILRYLDSFNKPIFMVAGNWDQSYGKSKIKNPDKNTFNYLKAFFDWWLGEKINPILTQGTKNVKDCMFKSINFKGINFLGYGLSSGPETPYSKHRKSKLLKGVSKKQMAILLKAYENLKLKLEKAYKGKPTIFITHNIPNNTKLDIITNKKSVAYKKHLGSTIAREFVDKFQPVLCVGGHIHDQRGKCKIKNTRTINPGFGVKAQVLVDLDETQGKIRSVKF